MNRLVLLGTKGGPGVRARGAMPTSTLLEMDGRRIVVDCGIGVTKGLVEAGIDLIVQKTGLGERLRAHLHAAHTTADNAARVARAAGVGRLVLNHLIPVDDPRFTPADWYAQTSAVWNGPVTLGTDGLEIPL